MKKKIPHFWLFNNIIISLISLSFLLWAFFAFRIDFRLKGDSSFILDLADSYHEPGYIAQRCNLFSCQDLNSAIKVRNNIEPGKIGTFTIIYELNNQNKQYTLKLLVEVKESEAPQIELSGATEIKACTGKGYVEPGFKAYDNYDGDITDQVKVSQEGNIIYYRVSDSSHNQSEVTRTINYTDEEKPVLKLKGASTIYLSKGTSYKEPGYTAQDNCSGDLASKVTVSGTVNPNENGTYTLTYSVTDLMGNTATVQRKVIVYSFDTDSLATYQVSLERYIKENNYKVSIGYYNINSGYTYKYNANQVYYGASLVKTLDALYVYENMTLTDELKALVKPTIEVSNNQTHAKLVQTIGFANLKNYGTKMGAKYTLTRGSSDYYGNTCVDDQLIYMKYLYNFINNSNVDVNKRTELKNYFINDYYNYLLFPNAPTIMHKYGYYGGYYHDVGIVLDSNPYIVVILTMEANRDFKIVTDLSQKIYEMHKLV